MVVARRCFTPRWSVTQVLLLARRSVIHREHAMASARGDVIPFIHPQVNFNHEWFSETMLVSVNHMGSDSYCCWQSVEHRPSDKPCLALYNYVGLP